MKKNRFLPLNPCRRNFQIYVVAVSGGPDSMFLIEKMRILGYKFVVAHVNYKKRFDSDFDEKIVRDYCQKNNISFFVRNFLELENCKGNFQAFARKFRYDFFFKVADDFSTKNVVIAHNFEDHLETYELQIERGSLVNFWGLPFKSFQNNYLLIRPLLLFNKKYIVKYLNDNNIKYAIDYTNDLNIYKRNVVRKKIFSFSEDDKLKIYYNILVKNRELKSKVNSSKKILSKVVRDNLLFLNDFWFSSESEIKERIIYYWINNFTQGRFFQRKKRVIPELIKQLGSSKANITFKLSDSFFIKKVFDLAFMCRC